MNKKNKYIIGFIVVVLCALFLLTKGFYSNEDGWIRDSDGLWMEHGNPKTIPDEVKKQYDAIFCAFLLYSEEKSKNITFDSQCLGTCKDYAIDIINVPRTDEDDLEENQCEDFLNGNVTKIIEIDNKANIVRIID